MTQNETRREREEEETFLCATVEVTYVDTFFAQPNASG